MKLNYDYTYCLSCGRPECSKCKRNINLYEKENIELYWIDSYYIRNSKSKKCIEYRIL